jgi:hypothetical protein
MDRFHASYKKMSKIGRQHHSYVIIVFNTKTMSMSIPPTEARVFLDLIDTLCVVRDAANV